MKLGTILQAALDFDPSEEGDPNLGSLELYVRHEGLEATDPAGQVEMAAFDMGYQGRPLAKWLIPLGKRFGIDVESEYQKGREGSLSVI